MDLTYEQKDLVLSEGFMDGAFVGAKRGGIVRKVNLSKGGPPPLGYRIFEVEARIFYPAPDVPFRQAVELYALR